MVAATASSQRGAPAASLRLPTTRRNRHAPHSATGTASSRIADTAAETLPPMTVASMAIGSTYGGAGTAVPCPSACHDSLCSRHRSRASAGAAESPPPLTGPIASRAPKSTSSTNTATPSATGLVRNRATRPVSASGASSSSRGSVVRRPARRDRMVLLGLGGRRAPAFGDVLGLQRQGRDEVADRVEAVTVGQPPRRQQSPDVVLVGAACSALLPLAPGGHAAGRGCRRARPGRRARRGPDRPRGPAGTRPPAAASRARGARPATAAPGLGRWRAACRAPHVAPGSACGGR